MPKRRDPPRPVEAERGAEEPPPEQEEVERAIRTVVERLKPKERGTKPGRKTRDGASRPAH